jgi:hypothetical protein
VESEGIENMIKFCGKTYEQNKNGTYLCKDSCIAFTMYNGYVLLKLRATQQRIAYVWCNDNECKDDQAIIDACTDQLLDNLVRFLKQTKNEYEKALKKVEKIGNEFDKIFILR